MELITTFQTGAVHGAASSGFTVYCRYSLPHLVCLSVNRPDDPFLSLPIDYFKGHDGYFAEQFFYNLHPNLNSSNVLSYVYQYATQTSSIINDLSYDDIVEELAKLVSVNKLQVIPLYD